MNEEELKQMQSKIHNLRQKIQTGRIYDSLGLQVGSLIDNIAPLQTATTVDQLSEYEIEEVFQTSEWLENQLLAGELIAVSDNELALLVNALGVVNPQIREEAAFKLLVQLIQEQILTTEQLVVLQKHILRPQVLFYHILEKNNDGAFLRSYNLYLLSVIKLWEQPIVMSNSEYDEMIELLAVYLVFEQDTRGFVDGKGWVNSYLHIGHILDALNFDTEIRRMDKILLMTIFFERYQRLDTPLMMGEENRLAAYLVNLLNLNQLYIDYFISLLKQLRQRLVQQSEPQNEAGWHCLHNQRRLFEALQMQPQIPQKVSDYLKNMNFF